MTTGATIQGIVLCLQLIALIYQVDMVLKSKKEKDNFAGFLLKHNTLHGKMVKAFNDNDMPLYREIKAEIRSMLEDTRDRAKKGIAP